jgi:hypothetical protein
MRSQLLFISHLFVCDTRAPLSFSPPFSKVNQARGNLLFPDPQFLSLGFLSVSAVCHPTHFIPCSIFSPHFQSISFHFFSLCWEPCKNKYTYQCGVSLIFSWHIALEMCQGLFPPSRFHDIKVGQSATHKLRQQLISQPVY